MSQRWQALWIAFAAVASAGAFAQPSFASPFISEIYLPQWGAIGIEVGGLGPAGATLLVVDASDGANLRVRMSQFLSPAAGFDVAVFGEAGWDTLPATQGLSLDYTPAPHSILPLTGHAALLLFEGVAPVNQGVRLGQVTLDPDAVVDWVGLGPGENLTQASAGRQALTAVIAAALGVDDLPRPLAPTGSVATLARPRVAGEPLLDALLPGSTLSINGSSRGLLDFPVTPGQANPDTEAVIDVPPLPEPGSAALLLPLLGAWGRRGRCPLARRSL